MHAGQSCNVDELCTGRSHSMDRKVQRARGERRGGERKCVKSVSEDSGHSSTTDSRRSVRSCENIRRE